MVRRVGVDILDLDAGARSKKIASVLFLCRRKNTAIIGDSERHVRLLCKRRTNAGQPDYDYRRCARVPEHWEISFRVRYFVVRRIPKNLSKPKLLSSASIKTSDTVIRRVATAMIYGARLNCIEVNIFTGKVV